MHRRSLSTLSKPQRLANEQHPDAHMGYVQEGKETDREAEDSCENAHHAILRHHIVVAVRAHREHYKNENENRHSADESKE